MASLLTAAALALLASGCGGSSEGGSSAAEGQNPAALQGTVVVSAAASLTDAFRDMETAFEAAHPAVDVILNLAGSSALREQILEGAPVDAFASANRENVERVVRAGEVAGSAVVFARNHPVIAVPAGNPGHVEGLADFARSELVVGLCAAPVPCGGVARDVLARAGVIPALDTDEPDARALLTKIELGEVDAGMVWATDIAAAAGAVEGIPVPEALRVSSEYVAVVLSRAPNPEVARAILAFVGSEDGQALLATHGFGPP